MLPNTPPREGLWKELTGRHAVSTTRQPNGSFREEGPLEDAALVLSQQAGRTDLIWAVRSQATPFSGFPDASKAQSTFADMAQRLFRLEPPRVAFAATFVSPVADRESGYRCLDGVLPNLALNSKAQDFLLQINLPRQSLSVPGVTINRLSKWSVAQFQLLSITPGGGVVVQGSPSQFAAQCEVDINTTAETQIPRGTSLVSLLQELQTLAEELKERGPVE
jgi:hypothetical protein